MPERAIPSLVLLRTFHAVAELASLTKASDLLKRKRQDVPALKARVPEKLGNG